MTVESGAAVQINRTNYRSFTAVDSISYYREQKTQDVVKREEQVVM